MQITIRIQYIQIFDPFYIGIGAIDLLYTMCIFVDEVNYCHHNLISQYKKRSCFSLNIIPQSLRHTMDKTSEVDQSLCHPIQQKMYSMIQVR